MTPEGTPLDLNNFPDDYNTNRDYTNKQAVDDNSSSSTGQRKKKNGGRNGKDESGKVYECRFCSLKFYKSQALGGHMNRHRQERETETLNRARQLVFSTHNMAVHHHLSGQPIPHGALYRQTPNIGDPTQYGPFYPPQPQPPRLFSYSPSTHLTPPPPQPPHQQFLYSSHSPHFIPYTSQHPPPHDYLVGHVLPPMETHRYTCIGEPVGQDFPANSGGDMAASSGGRTQVSFPEGL